MEGKECHTELSDEFSGFVEVCYLPEPFVDGPVQVVGDNTAVGHKIVQAIVVIP